MDGPNRIHFHRANNPSALWPWHFPLTHGSHHGLPSGENCQLIMGLLKNNQACSKKIAKKVAFLIRSKPKKKEKNWCFLTAQNDTLFQHKKTLRLLSRCQWMNERNTTQLPFLRGLKRRRKNKVPIFDDDLPLLFWWWLASYEIEDEKQRRKHFCFLNKFWCIFFGQIFTINYFFEFDEIEMVMTIHHGFRRKWDDTIPYLL